MRDDVVKKFLNFEDTLAFFKEQKDTDKWIRCKVNDLQLHNIPNAPILVKDIIERHQITALEEAVVNAMETTEAVLSFKKDDASVTYPLRYTAIKSLCDRAKLYGKTVQKKPIILNEGFMEYDDEALVLVRYDEISAVHSGREYAILNTYDILQVLKSSLDCNFSGNQFESATFTHELSAVSFSFPDQKNAIMASYNRILQKQGKNMQTDIIPVLLFATNDIAGSCACLYPYLKKGKQCIRIGEPLKLSHKGKHTVADFGMNTDRILSMIQDSSERLAKLSDIHLQYPGDCFKNIVSAYKLPYKEASAVLDDFEMTRPKDTTAFDLYWALWDIYFALEQTESSISRLLFVEEQIARVLHANWSKADKPIKSI